jgi:hypothetical protein
MGAGRLGVVETANLGAFALTREGRGVDAAAQRAFFLIFPRCLGAKPARFPARRDFRVGPDHGRHGNIVTAAEPVYRLEKL